MIKKMIIVFLCLMSSFVYSQDLDYNEFCRLRAIECYGKFTPFTITFLIGTIPTNLVLNSVYTGPISSTAMYDAGDGVWREYTTNNLPVVGRAVRFFGDWRTSSGTYNSMFYNSLTSTTFTCKFSGSFKNYPTHLNAYSQMFRNCTRVTSIEQNPIPNLVGTPAANMFYLACGNMSGVTGSLPTGFMDTSKLTGSPSVNMFAQACQNMSSVTGSLPAGFMDTSKLTGSPSLNMFYVACYNMSGVTGSLPTGFMDTSKLTGSPSANMFYLACVNMTSVTGSLPTGFMDTSKLTGSPSVNMFYQACVNMSGITSGDIYLGSNITFTSSNIVGTTNALYRMCYNMPLWNGNVYWGTNLIVNAIPIPDSSSQAFYNCTNMPNYSIIDANWK